MNRFPLLGLLICLCQLITCSLHVQGATASDEAEHALLLIAEHLTEYPDARFLLVLEAHSFKGTGYIHVNGGDTLPINLVRRSVTFCLLTSDRDC